MLGLQPVDERGVRRIAALDNARDDFLDLQSGRIRLPATLLIFPRQFRIKSRLLGLLRLLQRMLASNESTAFLSLPTSFGTAPQRRSDNRFVIAR